MLCLLLVSLCTCECLRGFVTSCLSTCVSVFWGQVGHDRLVVEASIHVIVRVCTVFFSLGPKAAASKGADSENNANAHLEFGFRLLDRLSRTERGLATLRRCAHNPAYHTTTRAHTHPCTVFALLACLDQFTRASCSPLLEAIASVSYSQPLSAVGIGMLELIGFNAQLVLAPCSLRLPATT